MIMYLVLSAFTSSPISLVAANKASVFFFTDYITNLFLLSHNKSRTEYILHSSEIMLVVQIRVKNI
jgi:hypothetical protein